MQLKENKIQSEIFIWYNNNYTIHNKGLIFAVPNGGTRNKREAMLLKATGVVAGVSDLICIMPNGKIVFVEVKTGTGVQSEKQKWFQKLVNVLGFEYKIVRSLDEFKELVKINFDIK